MREATVCRVSREDDVDNEKAVIVNLMTSNYCACKTLRECLVGVWGKKEERPMINQRGL